MKKIMSLALIVILSLHVSACSTMKAGESQKIIITNTASNSEARSKSDEIHLNEFVSFASKEESARILSKEDEYIKSLSKFDYASKFKSKKILNEEERYTFYNKSTLEWTDDEKLKISNAVDYLMKKTKNLNLNKPNLIKFIKTDGYEEGGAAYTRGESIIITQDDLDNLNTHDTNYIVAHEFFHVYSRYNEEEKENLYKIINFRKTSELTYPKEIKDLKISNPDAPNTNYYIECKYKDEIYKFMPIIYASREFNREYSDVFFRYLKDPLLAVTIENSEVKPVYIDGKPFILDKSEVYDFYFKTGENTHYTLHPEEIMADNFAMYIVGSKVNSQWVIDEMIDVMKKDKVIN